MAGRCRQGGHRSRIEGPFYGCEPMGKQGVVVALLGSSQDDFFNQFQVITQDAGNELLLSNRFLFSRAHLGSNSIFANKPDDPGCAFLVGVDQKPAVPILYLDTNPTAVSSNYCASLPHGFSHS